MKTVVGVDPGAKTGIVIFDLDMNLIFSDSILGGKKEIIEKILEYGNPCVVTTDKQNPPELVIELSSYFNARLFSPDREILEKEKVTLCKEYKYGMNECDKGKNKIKIIKTKHERDAASSAIYFFRKYNNKLRWIENIAERNNIDSIEEMDLKYLVLSGIQAQKALIALKQMKKIKAKEDIEKEKIGEERKESSELQKEKENERFISSLLRTIQNLKARLSVLESEKKNLKNKLTLLKAGTYNELRRDREISRLKFKIKKLEIEKEKKREEKEIKRDETDEEKDLKRLNKKVSEEISGLKNKNLEEILKKYRKKRWRNG